jgi:hypothetical protein
VIIPTEAISSSACTMATLLVPSAFLRSLAHQLENDSATEELGVIGYQAHTLAPPHTMPSAVAALPSAKMRPPTASARLTVRPSGCGRWSWAKLRPAWRARMLPSSSFSLPRYCSPNSASMTLASISSSTDSAPSTRMFLNSVRWRGSS